MTFGLGRLSPRRRAFVAGLAALVAAVAVVVAVVVLRPGPGAGGGAAAGGAAAGGSRAGYPAQDRPGPVLLVPGYGGNTGSLAQLAQRIRAAGRQATVLPLPGNGTGSLLTDAAVLNAAVNRALSQGAPSVDVIGYSAGGVATLIWARQDDGMRKARRIVTLGSPFHGAQIASAAEAFVPGACPTACQQLVPGSTLLSQLTATAVPSHPRWLSLWSTGDRTVTPPDSARLAGAVNVPVQAVCPAAQITHSELPVNPAVTAMVLHAIGAGPLRYPSAADCAS
jgi:triacylglycerol lipase